MTNPWGSTPPPDPNQPPFQPPPQPEQPMYPPPPMPGGYYPPAGPGGNYAPPPMPDGSYPPPPPYPGYPPMGMGFPPPPSHPQSTVAMVLGIVGLVLCGFASPFAIWLGRKSMREIDASGGQLGGRGQAQAGFIMGIIGTVFLVIGLVLVFTGVIGGIVSSPQ